MRVLNSTQRARFLDYINNNYTPVRDTPTHDLMQNADAYLRKPLNIHGPWASKVGTQDVTATYLGCRRNFNILFTDSG